MCVSTSDQAHQSQYLFTFFADISTDVVFLIEFLRIKHKMMFIHSFIHFYIRLLGIGSGTEDRLGDKNA